MAEPSHARSGSTAAGRTDTPPPEQDEGRPTGIPADSRTHAEGRPTVVRQAQPRTPPADTQPTDGAVDRGQTPDTELDPGQDL